jgi:hypothetical protein
VRILHSGRWNGVGDETATVCFDGGTVDECLDLLGQAVSVFESLGGSGIQKRLFYIIVSVNMIMFIVIMLRT